ncbi:MAG: hypothetical protein ABFR50_06115 [Candidatus Fermentibacteria bacterium]
MTQRDNEQSKMYLSYYNRKAKTEHQGQEYSFSEEDFEYLNSASNYWHHEQSPSTWLCWSTVNLARRKFGEILPRNKLILLCADTLNITVEKIESSLNWNANYMAWHDGGVPEEYHAYPDGVNE